MLRAASLFAAAMLAACSSQATPANEHSIPIDQAYAKLLGADLSDFRRIRQCGILIHFRPEGVPNSHVTWRVLSSGAEVLQFTARLTAVSADRTRVDVEIPKDPNGGEMYDGSQVYRRPALRAPTRAAIEEQVRASLEDRAFSLDNVPRIGDDSICNVQRGRLQSGGVPFTVNDEPEVGGPAARVWGP